MSIIKSIAIAALAFGIASGASAAESKFLSPATVTAIVKGEVMNMFNRLTDEDRVVMRNYLIGFGGGMHAECRILPASTVDELVNVMKNAMRNDQEASRTMKVGFEDGRLLAAKYGCDSDVGLAASRTVRGYMK
jgi:hypothetical protein